MKIGKDTQNAARRLFRLCMDGNSVVEDRVRLVARKIVEREPRNYEALLTAFSRMVEYAVKSRTAIIRSAVPLTDEERSQIQQKLAAKYGEGLYYHWEVARIAGRHPHPGGRRCARRFRSLQNRPAGRSGPLPFQLTNEPFFP